MKALLVIDMPNNCMECPLFREEFTLCPNIEKPLDEGKPNWCPLRPLPSKLVPFGYLDAGNEDGLYEKGYNDCIELITGETE